MKHQSEPQEPRTGSSPPVGTWARAHAVLQGSHLLNWVAALFRSPRAAVALHTCLLLVGILGQIVLLLVASYLVDLSVSLMELWAELARKHLEITL